MVAFNETRPRRWSPPLPVVEVPLPEPLTAMGLKLFSSSAMPPGTILLTPEPRENETEDDWLKRCLLIEGLEP